MRRQSCPARAAGILLLLGLWTAGVCPAERIVAIGDVHGAYDEFVSILQAAGLIDKDLEWTGGKTIFVQAGDVLDRGPKSKACLDLLMSLSEKAAKQGGEVRSLLGNHESMVMMGDLRYVSPDEYRSYATADSEKRREKEWQDYLKYRRQRAAHLRRSGLDAGEADQQAWMASHPPGYFELRQEFSPKGKYGRWLRSRDAVTQLGDVIFLHGGLSPDLPMKNVKEINEQVRREIAKMDDIWARLSALGVLWPYLNFDEAQNEAKAEWGFGNSDPNLKSLLQPFLSLQNWQILSPSGPLWYRGYAQETEASFAPQLSQILKRFKAQYVVVGHSIPATRRILVRFDGHVFLIDTGMLTSYFQGRPSALDINGGEFKSIYVGEPGQLLAGGAAAKGQ